MKQTIVGGLCGLLLLSVWLSRPASGSEAALRVIAVPLGAGEAQAESGLSAAALAAPFGQVELTVPPVALVGTAVTNTVILHNYEAVTRSVTVTLALDEATQVLGGDFAAERTWQGTLVPEQFQASLTLAQLTGGSDAYVNWCQPTRDSGRSSKGSGRTANRLPGPST
jgi:hypothetical protein